MIKGKFEDVVVAVCCFIIMVFACSPEAHCQISPSSSPPCAILSNGFVQGGQLCGPAIANLINIHITPTSLSTTVGSNASFVATGGYDDGTFADVTATSLWASTSNTVASPIPPNPGSNPMLFSCNNTGSVNITANLSGITGTASLSCNAIPPCVINTSSLPNGTVGTPYSVTLATTNCVPPVVWSLTSGSLPAGLSLASTTGIISGTPSLASTAIFTVQIIDVNSSTFTQSLSIVINAVSSGDPIPPQVFVDPDECVGHATQQFFVDGGVGTNHYPSTIAGVKSAYTQAETDRKNTGVGTFINMRPQWDGTTRTVFQLLAPSDQWVLPQTAGDTSTNCIWFRSALFANFPAGRIHPTVTLPVSVHRDNATSRYVVSFQTPFPAAMPAQPGEVRLWHMSDPTFDGTYVIGAYNSGIGQLLTAGGTTVGVSADSFGFAIISKPPGQGGLYDMWRLEAIAQQSPAIDVANGGHHYVMAQAEWVSMLTTNNTIQYYTLGGQKLTDPATDGKHNHVTQVYVHGYDKYNSGTGGDKETRIQDALRMNCDNCSINRSKIDQVHSVGDETHDILIKNSIGPLLIWDNDLWAGSGGVFIGGDPTTLGGGTLMPSDIEISGNDIDRDPSWYFISNNNTTGGKWSIKNLVEFKFGIRIVVYANRIRHNWADGQTGFIYLSSPRACSGACTGGNFSQLQDILFMDNIWSDSDQGITHTGRSGPAQGNGNGVTPPVRREKFVNNLFWGIGIHFLPTANGMQQGTNGEDYPATSAVRDSCPGGQCTVTFTLSALVNSVHHGMVAPDFVQVSGCNDATFNVDKYPTAAPTDYTTIPLTVFIKQTGQTPSVSATGCVISNAEGITDRFQWVHNTMIVDPTINKLMNDGHPKTFMKNYTVKDSLWATDTQGVNPPTVLTGLSCIGSSEGWFSATSGSQTCHDTDTLQWNHVAMPVDITKYAEFPGAVKPVVTMWNPRALCPGVVANDPTCVRFAGNYLFANPYLSGEIISWVNTGTQVNVAYRGDFFYSNSYLNETWDAGVTGPVGGLVFDPPVQGVGVTSYSRTSGVSTLSLIYPGNVMGSNTDPIYPNVPDDPTFNKCGPPYCSITAVGANSISYANCTPGAGCADVSNTPVTNALSSVVSISTISYYVRRPRGLSEPTASIFGTIARLGTISTFFSPWNGTGSYLDWRLCTGFGTPDPRCQQASYFAAGHPGQASDGKDLGVDFTELNSATNNGLMGARFPH